MDDLPEHRIETSLGPIVLRGHLDAFSPDRPLIFAIAGAFAQQNYLVGLPKVAPACDVAIAHLPGMWSPFLAESSVEAFALAFDEAIRTRCPGRAALVFGNSVGGLIALAMKEARALVLVDPPITTDVLWPLHGRLRGHVEAKGDPMLADWVWRVFGIGPTEIVNRDYRPLLNGSQKPGIVLIAGDPLGDPRDFDRQPGLLSTEDRLLFSRHPTLEVMVAGGCGHNLIREAPSAIIAALRRGLEILRQAQAPESVPKARQHR